MLALTFQVGQDRVAVNIARVREVVPRVRLTPATGGPAWVAGLFVYRGRVVPVIDLHRLTGAGECPPHLSSRIVLVPYPPQAESLVGLLATRVADVRKIQADWLPPASEWTSFGPSLPDGAGVLHILDPDALLKNVAAEWGGLVGSKVIE